MNINNEKYKKLSVSDTSAKWLPSLVKHFPIGAIIGGLIGGTR